MEKDCRQRKIQSGSGVDHCLIITKFLDLLSTQENVILAACICHEVTDPARVSFPLPNSEGGKNQAYFFLQFEIWKGLLDSTVHTNMRLLFKGNQQSRERKKMQASIKGHRRDKWITQTPHIAPPLSTVALSLCLEAPRCLPGTLALKESQGILSGRPEEVPLVNNHATFVKPVRWVANH